MGSKDEALGSMIGFETQKYYALEQLLKNRCSEGEITLENIDDVCFISLNDKYLYQIKHYGDRRNHITDASYDFWKTIYNWLNKFNNNIIDENDHIELVVYQSNKKIDDNFIFQMDRVITNSEAQILYDKLSKWYTDNYAKHKSNQSIKKYLDFIFNDKNKRNFLKVIVRFRLTVVNNELSFDDLFQKYVIGYMKDDYYQKVSAYIMKYFNDKILFEYNKSRKVTINIKKFNTDLNDFHHKLIESNYFKDATTPEQIMKYIKKNEPLEFVKQLEEMGMSSKKIVREKENYYSTNYNIKTYLDEELITIKEYEDLCENQVVIWENIKVLFDRDTKENAKHVFSQCTTGQSFRLADKEIDKKMINGNYHKILEDKIDEDFYWYKGEDEIE